MKNWHLSWHIHDEIRRNQLCEYLGGRIFQEERRASAKALGHFQKYRKQPGVVRAQ